MHFHALGMQHGVWAPIPIAMTQMADRWEDYLATSGSFTTTMGRGPNMTCVEPISQQMKAGKASDSPKDAAIPCR